MEKKLDIFGLMKDEELIAAEFLRLSINRGFSLNVRAISTKDEIADKTLKQILDPSARPPAPSISPRALPDVQTFGRKMKSLRLSAVVIPSEEPKDTLLKTPRDSSKSELDDMFDELEKLTEESVDDADRPEASKDDSSVVENESRRASIDISEHSENNPSTPKITLKKKEEVR